MEELTAKQNDFMIESGMEDLREKKADEYLDYEDVVCPNCESDEYEYTDESNFLDNPSIVYFRCKNCDCEFSALRHITYSKIEVEEQKVLN